MASEIRDTTASYSDASQAHWEGAKVVYGDTDSVFVWGSQNAVDRRGRALG